MTIRYTISDMNFYAALKEGRCLSKEYVNSTTKLLWQCHKGHTWETVPPIIRQGGWCPQCAGRARLTKADMNTSAEKRKGKCLSAEYVNYSTKLLWQCDKGHRWQATPRKILGGQWCPHYDCRYRKVSEKLRKDISEIRKLAEDRGGKLLSRTYVNRKTALKWQCAEGHRWMADASNVKFGPTWCPICARKRQGRKKETNTDANYQDSK